MNDLSNLGVSASTLLVSTEQAALIAKRKEDTISSGKGLGLLIVLGVILYLLVRR